MTAAGLHKKRILIFSVPFSGHLMILKEFIARFRGKFEIRLVITGWANIYPDLEGLPPGTGILSAPELHETDPALWTLPRTCRLLERCIQAAVEFEPDLILYDFFALEGYFAAGLLGIGSCCSIPAMVGANPGGSYLNEKLAEQGNLAAIAELKDRFGITFNQAEAEMISDGIHLPGPLNLVWSYPAVAPANWRANRSPARYVFVGNIRGRKLPRQKRDCPVIYLSLGTVVMGNLWNQQSETRSKLQGFFEQLSDLWQNKPYRVIIASHGRPLLSKYPSNWQVLDKADQLKCLARADLFITHGGSNSFHEALIQNVPMVVIPFFGDQPTVGGCVERLGIGLNLVHDRDISTKKPKTFIDESLAARLVEATEAILGSDRYLKNFEKIDFTSETLNEVFSQEGIC
jgi:UDP:flavonoid glycosyltransferase YjiC (YdhE family)